MLETVRMILSGVARISQRRAGCGKQLLAQMLTGSNAKGVVRNRLDKLSTFGLLAHLKQQEVVQLIDALLLCGLIEQTEIEPFRPVVQLTERGVVVMSGRESFAFVDPLPGELWRKINPTGSSSRQSGNGAAAISFNELAAADPGLVMALRSWRDAKRVAQNVPAYHILSNAVVEELARARPQSADELLAVKGMGPAKVRELRRGIAGDTGEADGRGRDRETRDQRGTTRAG